MAMTVARQQSAVVSAMLIVADAEAAVAWYKDALGATELWNLGAVVGLEVDGAPFFLHEAELGRIEPEARPDLRDSRGPARDGHPHRQEHGIGCESGGPDTRIGRMLWAAHGFGVPLRPRASVRGRACSHAERRW